MTSATQRQAPGHAAVVELLEISKSYGDVRALDRVSVNLEKEQIHALLGENGAGKTTLMNVIAGLTRPDGGVIKVRGTQTIVRSPAHATRLGIAMVHQHFRLISSLTVAENVHMGPRRFQTRYDLDALCRHTVDLASRYRLEVSPDARIWQLSVGEKQRVAILRALAHDARILILDEPTSVLSTGEADVLFGLLRSLRDQGNAIVLITHKLGDVVQVSDKVTILRRGRRIATLKTAETNERSLARDMVGDDQLFRFERGPMLPGAEVLQVHHVSITGDRGVPAVQDVSLEVRSGEVVGVAGVSGNGQRELAEALTGLRSIDSGEIHVTSELNETAANRIGHIPEDRDGIGLIPNESIEFNATLRTFRFAPINKLGFIRHSVARESAARVLKRANLTGGTIKTPVRHLSGGNRQRLLVSRELSSQNRLVIAAQPTTGLDIAATKAIWKVLLEARGLGQGVLLFSCDLDELLALSDRVLVMYAGRVVGEFAAAGFDRHAIGLLMGGIRPEADDLSKPPGPPIGVTAVDT